MTQKRQDHTAEPRLERIARRAHEIYQARGGTGGRELDDWLQAEREIDAATPQAPADTDILRGM